MRTLPDYLRKGMKMILVGPNPGDRSARVGHYYAGRTNLFWPILYESGVIPEPLSESARGELQRAWDKMLAARRTSGQ